jgi:hypothetical protein
VSDGAPDPRSLRAPAPSGDDEYIEGYAKGYGDGLREALRELRAHAGRGASPQELRMLIQSRLARIPDDVEVKRKGLLAPPRRAPWTSLLRPPMAPVWTPPKDSMPTPAVEGGETYLLKEERPRRALEIVERSAAGFRRVLLISQHPPTLSSVGADRVEWVRPGAARDDGGDGTPGLDPSGLAGRIRESGDAGPVLVYLDAIEFLATEYSLEVTMRFLGWATTDGVRNGSALVASLSPRTVDPRDLSRIERLFRIAQ